MQISIPSSVTELGEDAFKSNGLTDVFIPKGLSDIGKGAFSNCRNLAGITCAEGNKTYRAEGNCLLKKKVLILGCKTSEIPGSVTAIGDDAFRGCDGLTHIVIPDNITKIGNCVFEGCKDLISITIPETVTKIGYLLVSDDGNTVIKAVPGRTVSNLRQIPNRWNALEIIIKTALSQAEVFYENAEMECSFTPGVRKTGKPKRVG